MFGQQQQQQQQTRAPPQHHQQLPHGVAPVPMHGGAASLMMGPGGFPQPVNGSSCPLRPPFLPFLSWVGQGLILLVSHVNYPPQSYAVPPSMTHTSVSSMPSNIQPPQPTTKNPTTANPVYSTPTRPSQTSSQTQMQMQTTPTQTPPGAGASVPSSAAAAPAVVSPQVARERARVTALLDINSALLQEVVNLQAAGKAGVASNQPASQQASPTRENSTGSPSTADISPTNNNGSNTIAEANKSATPVKPSVEYIECMRRLQANLAYLATLADRAKKTGAAAPQAPAIMTPPPHLTSINELYVKLNELFPGAPRGSAPQTPQTQRPSHPQQSQLPISSQPGDGQTTPETAGWALGELAGMTFSQHAFSTRARIFIWCSMPRGYWGIHETHPLAFRPHPVAWPRSTWGESQV
jgi:hypothetical protein